MRTFAIVIAVILGLAAMTICAFTCNWVGDGIKTAHEEFDPSAMLKKYNWFKDQSQFILKAQKDVENLKSESGITEEFEQENGKNHASWSPIVQKSYQEAKEQNRQQSGTKRWRITTSMTACTSIAGC